MTEVVTQAAKLVTEMSDRDIEVFYRRHRVRLRRPETRVLRHILITINDDIPDNRRNKAQGRIGAIRRILLDHPQRFAELALEFSECPTALNGGLLGSVRRGQLYAELEPVAFALEAGELSALAESPMGLHLLRCDIIHVARSLSLAEVTPFIRSHLTKLREQARSR